MTDDKYLLKLLSEITHKKLFFGVWVAIVGAFVWLMVSHYRRQTRRNFKTSANKDPNTKG